MDLTEEEKRTAKGFQDIYPPEGAVLIETERSYTQAAPGRAYYWRTPDGQIWTDSDWIRHIKILEKLKRD